MKKYICIEGIIGSGKTTLAENLYSHFANKKLTPVLLKESFEHNKILELFYQAPDKYNSLAEYSFLIDRFHQIYRHFQERKNIITISDYSFRKCLWFAENNLSSVDFEGYKKHFLQLEKDLNIYPDVLIYLDVKPEIAYKNILKRGRQMEKNINIKYLEKLYSTYQKNILSFEKPVISIPVTDYNLLWQNAIDILNEHLK